MLNREFLAKRYYLLCHAPCLALQVSWAPPATRAFDAFYLADLARRRAREWLPAVQSFHSGPQQLSYWLAANLAVDSASKQVTISGTNIISFIAPIL